jgi:hypothetical protein
MIPEEAMDSRIIFAETLHDRVGRGELVRPSLPRTT